jgi:histidinol-phosphate aminotransferase
VTPPSATPLGLPHLAQLHAYTPGLQPTEPGWVKLNTNECPYPPSPRVAEALRREIGADGATLRLYPNPKSSPLRAAVAQLHGVGEDHVCIGNGSDDILNLLVRVFCDGARVSRPVGSTLSDRHDATNPLTGQETRAIAGFMIPSYSLYPVLVAIQDGVSAIIEFDRSMQLPLAAIATSTASVFFLTSPNAPTGVGFSNADLERILGAFRGVLVVDEAYAPFARENAVPLLARHPRLVIVRTLSKAYALAGIRVGYALAEPGLIGLLDRVRDSYNVNRLSQAAALAALGDPEYYRGMVARVQATRDANLARFASARGWFTYPSQANFLFTEPRDARGESGPAVAKAAYDFLVSRRVLVRHFPSHALTASFLRITVGTEGEMSVLHESLDAWLKTPPA